MKAVENKLIGKWFKDPRLMVMPQIKSISDFIAREPAVGILNAYAVVNTQYDLEYVVFENGEVQDDLGQVVCVDKNLAFGD